MGIPGVGFPELAIILVAALLIFGPTKLPEVMGQAGRAIRDFRKMTGNLQGEFEKNLNDVAGTDVRKTLSSEIANLKGEVQGASNAVTGKSGARSTTVPRPATTASKSTTGAAKTSTMSTSTAAKKTGSSVVGSSSSKTAGAAATAPADNGTGEIEFAPVLTSTRRRSGGLRLPQPSRPASLWSPRSRPK